MNKAAVLVAFLLFMLIPGECFSLHVKGVEIPEKVTQSGSRQQLILNGAGIRGKFIFDIYVGALYLPGKTSSADSILDNPAPAQISMYFLYDEISKQKMVGAWNEGFRSNLSETEFTGLKNEIDAFNAAFGKTVEGDKVVIDLLPDQTTRVTINNTEMAIIQGREFQRAVLSIWLGNSPVDGNLKRAMLGS